MIEGYDAVNDSLHPSTVCCGEFENDVDWHGTCCAGIIGAANNEIGIVGVAHTSKIIPIRYAHRVKVFYKEDPNNPSTWHWNFITHPMWIADAFNHACYDDTADVINCSFAVLSPSNVIDSKVTINDTILFIGQTEVFMSCLVLWFQAFR